MNKKFLSLAVVPMLLAGCADNINSDYYSVNQTGKVSTVSQCTVLSVRAVKVNSDSDAGTLIGGIAGGIGSFFIQLGAGRLFDKFAGTFIYPGAEEPAVISADNISKAIEHVNNPAIAELTRGATTNETTQLMLDKIQDIGGQIVDAPITMFGLDGKPAAYMIVFSLCAVAYLVAWAIMKSLVPRYKKIEI